MSTPILDLASYPPPAQAAIVLGVGVVAYYGYKIFTMGLRQRGLPPGPPALPIIGNLLVFPRALPHFQFTEWAREYGDVFSLKVLGQTMIVLNSPNVVREIFERRSLASCNRPKSTIADIITPNNLNLGTGRFANEAWKALRKASAQCLSNENLRKKRDFQKAEATQMMFDFYNDPDNWYHHISRFTTSYAMGLVYGLRNTSFKSKDVSDFLTAQRLFMEALEFGTMPPVDLIPILKYVPEYFAGWKRQANYIKSLHDELYGRLVDRVEERMKKGLSIESFMEEAITKQQQWGFKTRDYLTNFGGTLLEGSDTSSATLQYIVMCLVAYPEKQKKAQEEVDRVVGSQRAPTWDDIPNLPYVRALIEEVQRFRPVANLGLPHEMVRDEIVDGHLYPKDAVLWMNLYMIFHDERYFENPHDFVPERFLQHPLGVRSDIEDDPGRRANMLFGGGRRVCPGITFAKTSMEMNTVNWLWAFDFLPDVDPKTGKEIYPSVNDYASGITATPQPFKCRIKPRSAAKADMIQKEFAQAAEHLIPFELDLSKEDKEFNAKYRDVQH
ncbi:hypothetical protein AX16_005842 [Volvariella volvacea WC 439]|nr:hypothetical protein AX16_005842 [Volvariella volvacea WC 439]